MVRRRRSSAGFFDPTRTYIFPVDEEKAKLELAQLERAGLKPKKIVVPNGGWGPKRRKKRSAVTQTAPDPQENLFWLFE